MHDGSCFDPIQVLVDSDLEGYEDVLKLSTRLCCGFQRPLSGVEG